MKIVRAIAMNSMQITWDFSHCENYIIFTAFSKNQKNINSNNRIAKKMKFIKLFYFIFRTIGSPAFTASVISPGASYSW